MVVGNDIYEQMAAVADRDRPLLVALRAVEEATGGSPLVISVERAGAAAAPE
jgi:hypothetical protein